MSLSGNLEDVPLADVLQFIHLGRRTGTLSLSRDSIRAEIGFHHGQIVGAWSPSSKKLGDLLCESGLVERDFLDEALTIQQSKHPRRSLGKILVGLGVVTTDAIRKVVEEQIAQTVYELVTWTRGTFRFELDELRPIDNIGMYPGDIIPHIDLNTQMVLLEATRIFDERNRAREEGGGDGSFSGDDETEVHFDLQGVESGDGGVDADAEVEEDPFLDLLEEEDQVVSRPRITSALEGKIEPPRLQILSPDDEFCQQLATAVTKDVSHFVRVKIHEAGTRLPGEAPPVVIVDVRQGGSKVADIASLRYSRPRAPIIAVVDATVSPSEVFEAGALAALPGEVGAVVACLRSIIRNRIDVASGEEVNPAAGTKAGFARLRRILADLRSGLLSATVALNLLHIISESVERAILFLVKQHELVALGAFGFSDQGSPLAEATRGLRLELLGGDALTECVTDGQVRSMSFDQAGFPTELTELVGRPQNGQVVIFPVLGSQRVISVIYADNGLTNRPIEDIEILELATAQVGMAFENELLRRQSKEMRG